MSGQRYTIQEKIGKGGLGAVYLAYDNMLGRSVALKRLQGAGEESPEESPEKLLAEAKILSSLQHPNIVTIYDFGRDAEGFFVVMELLEGETLEDWIARGALVAEDFPALVEQTMEALIAAQEKDLLHRDLKPANLMVTSLPGKKFQVKILDFGLAKFSPRPSTQTEDQSESIFGSIYFMAPEQFERLPIDERTDLYAIGCVYYFALTGEYPFQADSAAAVMGAHLEHNFRPLDEARPDLDPWMTAWVMWLMSREAEHRPADAGEALRHFRDASVGEQADPELHALAHRKRIVLADGGETSPVAPPAVASEARTAEKRKRLFFVLAAAVASLSLAGGGIWWWRTAEERVFQKLVKGYRKDRRVFGDAETVALLIARMGRGDVGERDRRNARILLSRLRGEGVDEAILKGFRGKELKTRAKAGLLEVVKRRKLLKGLDVVFSWAGDRSAPRALRILAIQVIRELCDPVHLPKLFALLERSPALEERAATRKIAGTLLEGIDDPGKRRDLLLEEARKAGTNSASPIFELLGAEGGDQARDFLKDILADDSPQSRRIAALRGIGALPDAAAARILLDAAGNHEETSLFRREALKALLKGGGPRGDGDPAADWQEVMDAAGDDRKLRAMVLQACSKRPDVEAAAAFLQKFTGDSDAWMARYAKRLLERLQKPAAP